VPPAATHAFEGALQLMPRRERLVAVPARRDAPRDPFEGTRFAVLSGVTDAVMLWIAAAVALPAVGRGVASGTDVALAAALGAVAIGRLASQGMYGGRPSRMTALDTARQVASASIVATIVTLAAAAVAGAGREAVDTLLVTGAGGAVTVSAFRLALARARRRARLTGRSGRRAIIVGAGQVGLQLEQRLRAMPELGLEPIGFLDADPAPAYWSAPDASPVLGAPDELARVVEQTGAGHVIIAFCSAPDSAVQPLLRSCDELGLEVSVVPRLYEAVTARQWVEHVGGLPLCGLHRVDPKSWQFALKHAFDRGVAAALLLVLAPVLGVLAAAVRLSSPGPVLYRQRRVGRDGREFDILKFRSMRMECDRASEELKARLAAAGAAPGGVEGDDRRTRIGTFLRRSSLDELPQLVNVLLGHMSLVGPRPERPEFVDHFGQTVRRYDDRHRVKSGMTGWAQVHGLRGQTSLSERVEWDNWYIQNWSLWLDLKILLMTPLACVHAPSEDAAPVARPARSLSLAA
jgi:exopolysaccharide biosynthesis polyprenyl glycosylphosphotransferase